MPRDNQPRKTWQYTKDFKVTVVKLSYQAGIQVKHVAEGLDIHPFMLSRGRKEYGEGRLKPCTSATTKAPARTGDRQGCRKVEQRRSSCRAGAPLTHRRRSRHITLPQCVRVSAITQTTALLVSWRRPTALPFLLGRRIHPRAPRL